VAEVNSKAPSILQAGWTQGNSRPSVLSATQRLSSRPQDDVDSDISRFKLHYPLRVESGAAAKCGFQLSERTKSPGAEVTASVHFCPASRIWPCIGFSRGRAKAACYPHQRMVPAPPLDNTTRSTGKAWFTSAAYATLFPFSFPLPALPNFRQLLGLG
jgi:hypothetical protein